jgi:hypothetical protein
MSWRRRSGVRRLMPIEDRGHGGACAAIDRDLHEA